MIVKSVLLLSRTAHAQSKRNVEGEELQHSSPTPQTIPSASGPLSEPLRLLVAFRQRQYSCIASFCSLPDLFSLVLYLPKQPDLIYSITIHINRLPRAFVIESRAGALRILPDPVFTCTIKSLILMHKIHLRLCFLMQLHSCSFVNVPSISAVVSFFVCYPLPKKSWPCSSRRRTEQSAFSNSASFAK